MQYNIKTSLVRQSDSYIKCSDIQSKSKENPFTSVILRHCCYLPCRQDNDTKGAFCDNVGLSGVKVSIAKSFLEHSVLAECICIPFFGETQIYGSALLRNKEYVPTFPLTSE